MKRALAVCAFATAWGAYLPEPAAAAIYRCVGKDGQVTYSQTKPASGSCTEGSAAAPPSSGANPGSLMEYSKELDKAHEKEGKQKQKADQEQAQKEATCHKARARLAGLEQAGRIFTVDEKGERHYATDAEREAKIKAMQQVIAQTCE